ncbi:MAG: class I SAM-dependent methyltransferase [Mycobacterium sp.]|nr:class I SAM-dependent methyltransferase [Mycobacterium sp.]
MSTLWQSTDAGRGEEYDARWLPLLAAGQNIHGEADLVEALLAGTGGRTVLDAGCGTGRVAIELARRGFRVTGVDADPAMLAVARAKAPELVWVDGDLAAELPAERVDLALLAGNVMIFLQPATEGRVLANLASRLAPGGLLVAGFAVQPDRLPLERYDELADAAGLAAVARWSTWDRQPFGGGDYAVSVHRAPRNCAP